MKEEEEEEEERAGGAASPRRPGGRIEGVGGSGKIKETAVRSGPAVQDSCLPERRQPPSLVARICFSITVNYPHPSSILFPSSMCNIAQSISFWSMIENLMMIESIGSAQ